MIRDLVDSGEVFQHTAARRRLIALFNTDKCSMGFQHTAARRRLKMKMGETVFVMSVSTHSRPKAAE